MSPLRPGKKGTASSCDPGPSPQLSPAVHPSRPGVWAEPSLPGTGRWDLPAGIPHAATAGASRPSAAKGLRHPTFTSSPRGTVWKQPKRGEQAIPGEEEAPGPAWKSRRPGQRGAAAPCPGALRGPAPAPLDEGAVCAQAQARAASGAGSAPGAPGGLCQGRALCRLPGLSPLIFPPGQAQRDPLCCPGYIVLCRPSQAVMLRVLWSCLRIATALSGQAGNSSHHRAITMGRNDLSEHSSADLFQIL
ncbi:uncharacterized protein LOC113459042 isoform X1 [Zonotrichia albicollis]|uniref:uncharacterized protein LOC113459042 isoform X1 n=1 Tax=Zonotrichia albicollis TaxID=44394 RepID=UPI003D810CBD